MLVIQSIYKSVFPRETSWVFTKDHAHTLDISSLSEFNLHGTGGKSLACP